MLLGRVTYEGFAAAWPEREQADDEATAAFAKRFNSMPKYVVSTSLEEATWQNTTICGASTTLRASRTRSRGTSCSMGATRWSTACSTRDLVDVLRLMIFPVILGIGKRIFPDDLDDKIVFDLTDHRQNGSIVVHDYTRQGR